MNIIRQYDAHVFSFFDIEEDDVREACMTLMYDEPNMPINFIRLDLDHYDPEWVKAATVVRDWMFEQSDEFRKAFTSPIRNENGLMILVEFDC